MSLRALTAVVIGCLAVGCGGGQPSADEPTTAREKQAREAAANEDGGAKSWGRWRYKGDRDQCFFVLGARCFKTEKAACGAARCKAPQRCVTTGAGPTQVSCK